MAIKSASGNIFMGIILLAMPVFTAWVLVLNLRDAISAAQSVDWPITSGTVTYSQALRGCSRGGSYLTKVRYLYSVNGVQYHGDRLAFDGNDCRSTASTARARIAPYPVGVVVSVHYDPAQPSEATLISGSIWAKTCFFTLLQLILIATMLLASWRLFVKAYEILTE